MDTVVQSDCETDEFPREGLQQPFTAEYCVKYRTSLEWTSLGGLLAIPGQTITGCCV